LAARRELRHCRRAKSQHHGPPRLQRLDLLTDNDKELATLDNYEGG